MHWLPKTKIGKISFWAGISLVVFLYVQYWLSLLFFQGNCVEGVCVSAVLVIFRIVLSWLTLGGLFVCGITSVISIIKYHDRAIVLFVSALLGFIGIMFVLGEFLFPH